MPDEVYFHLNFFGIPLNLLMYYGHSIAFLFHFYSLFRLCPLNFPILSGEGGSLPVMLVVQLD